MDVKDINLVLIAEGVARDEKHIDENDTTLEMAEEGYKKDLTQALANAVNSLTVYSSPKELQKNIAKHQNSLVMTVYGGENSRNRMALIPAICEAHEVAFMGADVYARILCQDKAISKELAKRHGMPSAKYFLVEHSEDLNSASFKAMKLPLVVKPNMEGSSIGISLENLCETPGKARELASKLLKKFKQPVIIEEFLPGKEICICIAGSQGDIVHFEAVENVHKNHDGYFQDKLLCYELKKKNFHDLTFTPATKTLPSGAIEAAKKLFLSLGKIDYLRIDGRIVGDTFHLIELTPDPYLAKGGSFSNSFKFAGISYAGGLEMLIRCSVKNYRFPCANAQGNRA